MKYIRWTGMIFRTARAWAAGSHLTFSGRCYQQFHFVWYHIGLFFSSSLFTRSLNISFVSSWTLNCSNIIVMYPETSIIFLNIGPLFTMANSRSGPRPPHYRGFMITLRHTTVSRTPLDEWSARRRDLYMTTHNTRKRRTSCL